MEPQKIFFADNLKFLRKRMKMSQEDLAEKLSAFSKTAISRAKLASLETGRTTGATWEDQIIFSDYYRIAIDTLVRVDLSRISELQLRELQAGNDVFLKGGKLRVLATTVTPDNKEQVELVTVKAKAGYTAGYSDPDFIAELPFFHLPQLPKDRKFRMFATSGDSMLPVPEGAHVIVEYIQDWTEVKDGTPCIVVTKNDGLVFKIVDNRIKETETLLLTSLNPSYKPYEIPVTEVLELWKYHSYWTDAKPEPQSDLHHLTQAINEMREDLKIIKNR